MRVESINPGQAWINHLIDAHDSIWFSMSEQEHIAQWPHCDFQMSRQLNSDSRNQQEKGEA